MTGIDKAVRDDAYRLLIERRAEIYTKVAALLMDLEGALELDDWERARYNLEDLRRTLRTSLAFLTDEVYEELEHIEVLSGMTAGTVARELPANVKELRDHLQLLHVKLSRSLKVPDFQDLEDIVGLDLRLKRKLRESRQDLADKIRQRERDEESWEYEGLAREQIAAQQYRKALKNLQQAVRLDPHRAVFHNDLGYVYSLLKAPHKAVASYREAVRINESYPERRSDEWMTSYFNLGISLRKLAHQCFEEQTEEKALAYSRDAIRAFENYLKVMPTGPKVSFTRTAIVQLSEAASLLEERLFPEAEVA